MEKLPSILVLFGITGDLSTNKILPGIYDLYKKNLLPDRFRVIGISRREWGDQELREHVNQLIRSKEKDIDEISFQRFLMLFHYEKGNFDDNNTYKNVLNHIKRIEAELGACTNKLLYLSVPPSFYEVIFLGIKSSGLAKDCSSKTGWARILVEKPFGKDLESARSLEEQLRKLFNEEQIFRVDHYLGKEMVQNILAFRFSNNLFEESWNNRHIGSISIYVPEEFGIRGRTNFYEGIGALRDVGQNHLLQMLAILTMEEPKEYTAESIRKRREELLNSLEIYKEEQVAKYTYRAQYGSYKFEEGVDENSTTETYFKIKAFLKNRRWKNVPIYLESGKKLNETDKKIYVVFKEKNGQQNKVVFDLEGEDMGIGIEFFAKKPGFSMDIEKKVFMYSLCDDYDECNIAGEYEKLLLDAIDGDQTMFLSSEEVNAMWKFVDPIVRSWKDNVVPLNYYDDNSVMSTNL